MVEKVTKDHNYMAVSSVCKYLERCHKHMKLKPVVGEFPLSMYGVSAAINRQHNPDGHLTAQITTSRSAPPRTRAARMTNAVLG